MDWSSDDAQQAVIRENVRAATERERVAGINLNVTLPVEVYDWLRDYSREQGMGMSTVVRSLVVAFRAEEENRG